MTKETIPQIVTAIKDAQTGKIDRAEVFKAATPSTKKHEFLFFIKPEILIDNGRMNIAAILEMFFERATAAHMDIDNIAVLSGKYLEDHNIISQHYGVINQIACNPRQGVSDAGKTKFAEIFGTDFNTANVMGGIEFLAKYPQFNADSLETMFDSLGSKKVAGGTYVVPVKIGGELVYLFNGFHPKQVLHFTGAGRLIVVMTLKGDMSWADARTNFIGATNPSTAEIGSLRRTLLDTKDALGLDDVSMGYNGFHLSAGPVEGLVELIRYNSDHAAKQIKTAEDFVFGRSLKGTLNATQLERVLSNDNIPQGEKMVSVFDLTEEADADTALEKLKAVL